MTCAPHRSFVAVCNKLSINIPDAQAARIKSWCNDYILLVQSEIKKTSDKVKRREEKVELERRRKEEDELRKTEERGFPAFESAKGDYDDLAYVGSNFTWLSSPPGAREDFYSFWMEENGAKMHLQTKSKSPGR